MPGNESLNSLLAVIPVQTGIHQATTTDLVTVDSRIRGNDARGGLATYPGYATLL